MEESEPEQSWDDNWKTEQEQAKPLPSIKVESCYGITAGSFCRNLLRPLETSITAPGGGTLGKSGVAKIWKWKTKEFMEISYGVFLDEDCPKVFIQFKTNDTIRSQEIQVDTIPTTFGNKPRLLCDCGHAGKLYLRDDCLAFLCRNCAKICYGVRGLDKRWGFNALNYYLDRRDKLNFMSATIHRPTFFDKVIQKERYTRKARALLGLHKKWKTNSSLMAKVYAIVSPKA